MAKLELMAILIVDASGSTHAYDWNPAQAVAAIEAITKRFTKVCADHGCVAFTSAATKSTGDGAIGMFRSADAALEAAVEFMDLCKADPAFEMGSPLPFRLGMHTGDVYVKDDDVQGHAVNVAHRLTGIAYNQSLFVTGSTLSVDSDVKRTIIWHYEGEKELEGIDMTMDVFSVWTFAKTIDRKEDPVTELKALHRQMENLETVLVNETRKACPAVTTKYFMKEIYDSIVTNIQRFLDIDHVCIMVPKQSSLGRDYLQVVSQACVNPAHIIHLTGTRIVRAAPGEQSGFTWQSVDTRAPVLVDNVRAPEHEKVYVPCYRGIVSEFVFPIFDGDKLLAVVNLESQEEHHLSNAFRRLVNIISEIVKARIHANDERLCILELAAREIIGRLSTILRKGMGDDSSPDRVEIAAQSAYSQFRSILGSESEDIYFGVMIVSDKGDSGSWPGGQPVAFEPFFKELLRLRDPFYIDFSEWRPDTCRSLHSLRPTASLFGAIPLATDRGQSSIYLVITADSPPGSPYYEESEKTFFLAYYLAAQALFTPTESGEMLPLDRSDVVAAIQERLHERSKFSIIRTVGIDNMISQSYYLRDRNQAAQEAAKALETGICQLGNLVPCIICREGLPLAHSTRSPIRTDELNDRRKSPPRKTDPAFARWLINELSLRHGDGDPRSAPGVPGFIVIGDAVADTQLALSLRQEGARSVAMFIRNEQTLVTPGQLQMLPGSLLTPSWAGVTEAAMTYIRNQKHEEKLQIAIFDIDRTLLLPRGIQDAEFDEQRGMALVEYCQSLCPDMTASQVMENKDCIEQFAHFDTNDADVLALATLMFGVGLLTKDEMRRNRREEISWWVERATRENIDSLGLSEEAAELLDMYLWKVRHRMSQNLPVIVPDYREAESRAMFSLLKQGRLGINGALVQLVQDCCERGYVPIAVSDRPSASFGLQVEPTMVLGLSLKNDVIFGRTKLVYEG